MSFERFKTETRGKDISELKQIEAELRKELMKANMGVMQGNQKKAYGTKHKSPTIKNVKRKIAIVQTYINQKSNQLNLKRKK